MRWVQELMKPWWPWSPHSTLLNITMNIVSLTLMGVFSGIVFALVATNLSATIDLVPKVALFLAIIGLAIVVFIEAIREQFVVGPIRVPEEIAKLGYADEVISRRIRDEIKAIQMTVSTITSASDDDRLKVTAAPETITEATNLNVSVPGIGISLKWIMDYFRRLIGKEPNTIFGDIITNSNCLILRLHAKGTQSEAMVTKASTVDNLIVEAASKYFYATKPDVLAAYYNKKGTDYIKSADFEKAIEMFQRSIQSSSKDRESIYLAETFTNWGLACAGGGDLNEAEAKFREALELYPESAYTYVTWGNALRKSDLGKAVEKFRSAREYAYAYVSWGDVLRQEEQKKKPEDRNFETTMMKYQKAVKINSRYDYAHIAWGIVLLDDLNEPAAAAERFREAIKINAGHAQAHVLLGRAVAAASKDRVGAVKQFKRAVEIDPHYAYAYVAWGDVLFPSDVAAASDKFRKAVEINPLYANAYTRWAEALLEQGDFREANEKFRRAVRADPRENYPRVRWGQALVEVPDPAKRDPAGAIARFREALWLDPNYDYAYVAWGKWLLSVARSPTSAFAMWAAAGAVAKLQRVIKISPGHVEARTLLAEARGLLRRHCARMRMRPRALRCAPSSGSSANGLRPG